MPEQTLVDAAVIEERIEDQLLGLLEDPRWRRQGRAGAPADQLPEQHPQCQYDQRRHHPYRGLACHLDVFVGTRWPLDRKSTRLNSSHEWSSYAVFCLKQKRKD